MTKKTVKKKTVAKKTPTVKKTVKKAIKNKAPPPAEKKPRKPRKQSRAERVIRFIERYCFVPEGPLVGQPVKLDKFQKKFIKAVYDNPHKTREAILSIARKNGKTALIACLVLAHLVGTEAVMNSQIASGAMSKENAGLVFKACHKMIMLNPELAKIIRVVPSQKQLFGLPMNVEYTALSKDGKTNMGGSPILLILDETGQVTGPSDPFIDAVITSQGAHDNPLRIVISTQAPTDADLFSIWIDDALTGKDPQKVCHLYAADESADVLDEKAWYAANPALGIFRNLDDMVKMANDASRMPSFENAFRNLYLNQRISTNSPFISRNAWNACNGPCVAIDQCEELYGGLDLSARTDLTAFVLLGLYQGNWYSYVWAWTPEQGLLERTRRDRAPYDLWVRQGFLTTTPGAMIDYEYIAYQLADITSGLNITAIAYDRWRISIMQKELERISLELPLLEFGQGFKDMSPALDAVESRVLNKTLRHAANPVLTMCAANSMVVMDPAGNRKLDKKKTSGRIDAMVALAMAAGMAERMHEQEEDISDFINNPLIL